MVRARVAAATLFSLLAAFGAAFANAAPANQRSANPEDFRVPTVKRLGDRPFCYIDRVMIGPDKVHFVAWENDAYSVTGQRAMLPPSAVIFGRIGGRGEPDKDVFSTVSGQGLRLFPIRWSTDGGKLFIRVREPRGRIISIAPDRDAVSPEYDLSVNWKKIDVSSTKHGDLSFLDDDRSKNILERFGGDQYARGVLTLGSTPNFLGVRTSDLFIERLEAQGDRLHLPAGWTRNLIALDLADRSYPGGVSYLGANRHGAGSYFPYQRALVDFRTGRSVGVFDPTGVRPDAKELAPLSTAVAEALGRNPGAMVLDASMDGNVGMALLRRKDGTRSIIRLADGESREKALCTDRSGVQGRSAGEWEFVSFDSSRMKVGESELFGVRFSKSPSRSKTLVIYFHGGPGGSLADSLWQFHARRLVNPERELMAIEYAGSTGLGSAVSRRLSEHGMKALEQDVDKLAKWIRDQGYRRVFLIDESFGGVAGTLMQKYHGKLVDRSFHIAPLLKLQDPSAWAARGNGFNSVNATTQIAYERAMFGGIKKRSRFAAELAMLRAALPLDGRSNFYFGELDPISQPDQLISDSSAGVMVIPRAGHMVVGATDDLWKDIEKKILFAESSSDRQRPSMP